MATLSEINETLKAQIEIQEQTNSGISSLSDKFADYLSTLRSDRLQEIEDKREAKAEAKLAKDKDVTPTTFMGGLKEGIGLTSLQGWMQNFFGTFFGYVFGRGGGLIGFLKGALGLAAGKAIKWGLIGTLVASFIGDEIVNWLDPNGDGIVKLPTGLELNLKDPLVVGGLILAAGAITRALVGFVASSFVSLGALGLASLFGAAGFKTLESVMREAARRMSPISSGRGTAAGQARPPAPPRQPPTRPVSLTPGGSLPRPNVPMTLPEAQAIIRQNIDNLPRGTTITPQGRLLQSQPSGPPRFVSPITVAQEIVDRPAVPPAPPAQPVSSGRGATMRRFAATSANVGLKALNVLALVDMFFNPNTLGFQNIAPSDMDTATAEQIEKLRKMMAVGGYTAVPKVIEYLQTPTGLGIDGKATLAEVFNLQDMLALSNQEWVDLANKIRMEAIKTGEIPLASAARPVGTVSSARISGQRGMVNIGEELTALDVIEQERARRGVQVLPVPTPVPVPSAQNNGGGGGTFLLPAAPTIDILDGITIAP